MRYDWESVGDQDACTRKVCWLGPYLLEHVEDHWKTVGKDKYGENISKMMMVSRIYLWNDETKEYDIIEELDPIEYERDKSYRNAEDWYATNVLFEELMMGDSNEQRKN